MSKIKRLFYRLGGVNRPRVKVIVGNITGATDVDAAGFSFDCPGVESVTKSAEGVMDILLDKKYPELLGVSVHLAVGTWIVTRVVSTVDTDRKIKVYTYTKANLANAGDIDADTAYIMLWLREVVAFA